MQSKVSYHQQITYFQTYTSIMVGISNADSSYLEMKEEYFMDHFCFSGGTSFPNYLFLCMDREYREYKLIRSSVHLDIKLCILLRSDRITCILK